MNHREWVVENEVDPTRAAEVLASEPEWTVYALGDLEPPFAKYTSVSVGHSVTGDGLAVCMTLQHPSFNAVMSAGEASGVNKLLGSMDLPRETLVSIREEHHDEFVRKFAFANGLQRMRRLILDPELRLPPADAARPAVRLDVSDADALVDLYEGYAGSSFSPDHLVAGVFYGARHNGRLVAAAGTHVVSERQHVAAIGSVFTRPESRGQGLAESLAAAVARELREKGCTTIALNVAIENVTAERIYRRLGFREHCTFLEGEGRLR